MAVKMSKRDEEALAAAGAAWNAANATGDKAAMEAAHAQAEAIRANYGYSGGQDGSKYIPISGSSSGSSKSGSSGSGSSSTKSTYTPLDNSGNDYASLVGMSDLHKAALEAAGNAFNSATTDEERNAAHARAEAIRALYGYSGGQDGSQYIPMAEEKKPSGGSFSYEEAPSYTDKYSEQIDALLDEILTRDGFTFEDAPTYADRYTGQINEMLNAILGREDFAYDAASDPMYQQYQQQYQREGQRAMRDTLGQMAARTGGLASSYATSVAQQANDYYASQAADRIPELTQLAYSMYLDDLSSQFQDISLLQDMSDTEYGRFRDTLNDWSNERAQAYAMYLDDIEGQVRDLGLLESMSDTQYNRYRDTMSDWRDDRDFAYGVYRDGIADSQYEDERNSFISETVFNQALQKAETLAAAGDFSGYRALGYTDAEIASMKAAYSAQQKGGVGEDYQTVDVVPNIASYNEAVAYLKKRSIPSENYAGLMTEDEWKRRKASYQNYGQGGAEVTAYDTYADYVKEYIQYCIETFGE